jgi:tetratricopeptide (TPR) repeat protein
MLAVEERNVALERAWPLYAALDFRALVALLEPIPREDLLAEPELGYYMASALRKIGRPEPALALLEELKEPCERRGNHWLYRCWLNLRAVLCFELARIGEAESLWLLLLDVASRADDHVRLAAAGGNLGLIAGLRCQWEEALSCFARATAAYQRLGELRWVGLGYGNMGAVLRDMGRFTEADTYLQQSTTLAALTGDEEQLIIAGGTRAQVLHAMGDTRLAEAMARRALERAVRYGNAWLEAEVLVALGMVLLGQQQFAPARHALGDALERLARTPRPWIEAEVFEQLALLERAEGNTAAEAVAAGEAARRYLALSSPARAEAIRARHGLVATF